MNSAAGSFGLSFGLAVAGAIMLASLAIGFTQLSNSSTVLSPDQQTQVATALESDAQIVSDTLGEVLAGQPEATQAEILRINDQAREVALQVALLVPIIAGVLGFANAFWMVRTPEPKPSAATEGCCSADPCRPVPWMRPGPDGETLWSTRRCIDGHRTTFRDPVGRTDGVDGRRCRGRALDETAGDRAPRQMPTRSRW